jgi:hypothetical protein
VKCVATLLLLLSAASLSAQDATQEKPFVIFGHAFMDAYWMTSNHDPEIEGSTGFWLRRLYLTFDKTFTDTLSVRVGFEANSPGDFTATTSLNPYVKDAWLRWKHSEKLELFAGISTTPAWPTVEKIWGYRAVERTPVDLQRLATARDFGVAAMGQLGRVRYHVQAGNGSSLGSETNTGKKVSGSVQIPLTNAIAVEVYADHDDREGDDDRSLGQVFAWLQREKYRTGVFYAHQAREDGNLDVASIFGVVAVANRVSLLARVDRIFDPNPEGDRIAYLPFDPTTESTLFIAGVDWAVHKNVSVIPNVTVIHYDNGVTQDVLPKLTLSLKY